MNMEQKHHFHTIIIGAGPAGLSCATVLARAGRKVLVLERNNRIGLKVCAGGVTWSGLAKKLPDEIIEKSFTHQHICSRRQQTVISASEPIISTINRENVGQWMAAKAVHAGAKILTDSPVLKIVGTKIITKASTFTYDNLVGADGSNSIVRRWLKIPVENIGAGIHYHVPGDFKKMVWHLDPNLFNTGYAWIFPHRTRASIGAYANRADISPSLLKVKLHEWAAKNGINFNGLKAEAATISFDYRGWHFGNTFLAGDAAGLASGLTGEGIYPAVCSGETIARTIIDPAYDGIEFAKITKKQKQHVRLLRLCGKKKFIAQIVLESLIYALRLKIISFKALEMGN